MGAATYSVAYQIEHVNGIREAVGTVTMSSSYATGGDTLDLSAVFTGSPHVVLTGSGGYVAEHDKGTAAAGKVIAYRAGAASAVLAQPDASTDLDAFSFNFRAVGVGA